MLGLIGKKVGMTQVFDAQGRLTPVTVIKIEGNVVVAERTDAKNGYKAAVLGSIDKRKVLSPSRMPASSRIFANRSVFLLSFVIMTRT